MSITAPEPKANMGQPIPRYDAAAKVTGKAQYGADVALVDPVYAFLVTSSIAKGRIDSFDLTVAKQVRGVVDIVTSRKRRKTERGQALQQRRLHVQHHPAFEVGRYRPGRSDRRRRVGQDLEAARQAAYAVKVNYTAAIPTTTFNSPGTTSAPAKGQLSQFKEDPKVGDFAKSFDAAEVKITAEYETPPQHRNPMELFVTSCAWNGDNLTIYEPTRYVRTQERCRRTTRYRRRQGLGHQLIRRGRLRLEGVDDAAGRSSLRSPGASAGRSSSLPPATKASPSPRSVPRPAIRSNSAPLETAS